MASAARPKKRFGQHFLTDRHYLARIVAAIDPRPGDSMVEIGPGTGLLTEHLAAVVAPLHVVEIDRDLAAKLRSRVTPARVVVHGPVSRDEVATLLAAADVFVLPSYQEPYGTVYGEALAMGLPLAGWRAGNLPHLAQDGRQAVLAPAGDVPALAAAVCRLASDEELRRRLSRGAKVRGGALPRWDDSARRFFQVLHDVAARAG